MSWRNRSSSLCHRPQTVVFMNTGTDALLHALHVARAATGRQRVFKFHGHYHGWVGHLGVGASFDVEPGIAAQPDVSNSGGAEAGLAGLVDVVDWNDGEATRAAFAAHGDEYAAAFLEPLSPLVHERAPLPGFLELLRELTERTASCSTRRSRPRRPPSGWWPDAPTTAPQPPGAARRHRAGD